MSVEERLRRRIEKRGPLPFAAFMEEALYGEGGYYARQELAIGPRGDFVTGSSLSPLFGRTTARLLRRLDSALGAPAELLEVGPGNGVHLAAVAASLADSPRRLLACDRVRRVWPAGVEAIERPEEVAGLRGMIFSYELFDALPVSRLIGREGGAVEELRVAVGAAGDFGWLAARVEDERLPRWLERRGVRLAPGQIADISLEWEPLYRRLARTLGEGLLVTCDYGFETASLFDPRTRAGGTLACYQDHRVHRDPLRSIGAQDLTAHVDLAALREAGESEGLETVALVRQALYLAASGVFDELQADPGLRQDAQALLDGEGMGEEIRVLVQARGEEGRADWIRIFEQLFKWSDTGPENFASGSSQF
jgi:SAM-dependent MidA family methyltransferase